MSAPPQQPTVTEREARQVAEAAREQDWHKPSFAKELFLGRFRLDLIHPHPLPADEDARRGEEFLARLRDFCETKIDAARIEREARIPDETIDGLKELGALGMKIDTKYGGLGLTQVYYNKALALVGSASPAIGALLSAHQSIGVPQPLKLFGTQEQKDAFLPRCARTDISAFLLTEPDVGSDPARLATTAVPGRRRLRPRRREALDHQRRRRRPARRHGPRARSPRRHKGGITAFVVEAASEGITVEHRNAFMGLRGLENGVTRFHRVRVPAAHRIGPEGAGLKIALTTLNTGRLSLPAMCVGAGKWCLKIAREWSAAREQWGRPVALHEAVGAKISFIAATTFALEAVRRPVLADGRRGPQRHPHRGRPRQALRLRDGLADGRRTGPDPRRPRLRDRRVPGRPRRARRPGRADPARPAHQPHLRGLDRDHAPADRPGGRGRPPVGRRRPHRPRQVPLATRRGRARTPACSTPSGCPGWSPEPASCPRSYGEFKHEVDLSAAPALRRARRPQARPVDLLRHVALAGPDGDQAGLPRPDRRHRRRTVRHERRLRPRRTPAQHRRPRARGLPARRRLLPAVPHPRGGTLRPALVQHRRPRPHRGQGRAVGHLRLAGGRRGRPLRRRPLDRRRDARPQPRPNVHRPVR